MEHIFIINPVAGKENPEKTVMPYIEKAINKHPELDIKTICTQRQGHACEIAGELGKTGKHARLYAVGGDGTLNELFEGAYKYKNLEVAAIPCGTGNDFVRNFGKEKDYMDIEQQLNGQAIPIDLVQTDKNICASITSVGLDAEVAYGIPKFRRVPLVNGSMAYIASIAQRLFMPMGQQLDIQIDSEKISGKYLILTVCNGGFYGGGFNAAPNAKLNDGILNVILVKKMSRLLIANVIGKYKKGVHFEGDKIKGNLSKIMQHYEGKEIIVTPGKIADGFILNIDGECGKAPRLYAKVLPLAGKFSLPVHLYQKYKS